MITIELKIGDCWKWKEITNSAVTAASKIGKCCAVLLTKHSKVDDSFWGFSGAVFFPPSRGGMRENRKRNLGHMIWESDTRKKPNFISFFLIKS